MTVSTLNSHSLEGTGSATDSVPVRVLVFLCNSVARWGLCSMLDTLPSVRGVDGCEGEDDAGRMLREKEYDLVIVADTLTDDQLEELNRVARGRGARVVMLLQESSGECLKRSSAQHMDGFLVEAGLTPEVLADVIERLARGEMPMPAAVAKGLLAMARDREYVPPPGLFLTPRERQTLALLVDGCSNKQIARRLSISENGAKRHVANVLAKLNCPNRTLAVVAALREGLVQRAS